MTFKSQMDEYGKCPCCGRPMSFEGLDLDLIKCSNPLREEDKTPWGKATIPRNHIPRPLRSNGQTVTDGRGIGCPLPQRKDDP